MPHLHTRASQNPVEHQLRAVQPLVSTACELARKGGQLQAAQTLACLRAVAEFMGLCFELKTLPPNLEEIEAAVLQNLDTSGGCRAVSWEHWGRQQRLRARLRS